jgi:hypothetical protein
MPFFPFNILAPITLGRKGPKGDPGDTPTSIAWESVTDKPATFPAAGVGDDSSEILQYHDGSGPPAQPSRFVMRHPAFGVTHKSADDVRDDILEAAKKPLGPYANDAAASAGGVAIGHLYYTADGSVKRRIS